jgi:hypothetical protein
MSHKEEGIRVPVRRRAAVRKSGLLIAALAMFAMSPAFGNFTCAGKVTYLGLSPDGLVTMSVGGFGVWYICSQTTTFAGHGGVTFSPEGCRSWFATILAAQKSGGSITFFFQSSSGNGNGPECTALGSWTQPNPAPYHMNTSD